jgi:hypothetical protein
MISIMSIIIIVFMLIHPSMDILALMRQRGHTGITHIVGSLKLYMSRVTRSRESCKEDLKVIETLILGLFCN